MEKKKRARRIPVKNVTDDFDDPCEVVEALLHEAKREQGFKFYLLCGEVGISRATLHRWRREGTNVKLHRLLALARSLGLVLTFRRRTDVGEDGPMEWTDERE